MWADRQLKRHLSWYEKSSLPTTTGRALILPGEPGTEVEELITVGYAPENIYCIERDQQRADSLYEHYLDDCHIHWEEVGRWMGLARGERRYSYLHIDYCSQLKREELTGLQAWTRLVAPVARVRVSCFRGRRGVEQMGLESMLHDQLLVRLCEEAMKRDGTNPDRWLRYRDSFRELTDDTTQLLVGVGLFNFFFGIPLIWVFTDEVVRTGAFFPEVRGQHLLSNIQRYAYHEADEPNHMYTTWFDLAPIPADTVRHQENWVVNELAKVFEAIAFPAPQYNENIHR